MVSSMLLSKKASIGLLALFLVLALPARGEGIGVHSALIAPSEEGYYLNADFDLELTPALEEALNHGIPLTFLFSFELIQSRWYWFDRTVADIQQERKLSYNPLTRVYRYSIGSLYLSFNSLSDALQSISRVKRMHVTDLSGLAKGSVYEGHLQMRLDISRLPKPLQVDALSSGEWKLSSRPYSWKVTP